MKLQVLVMRSGNRWVVIGLEHGVSAQAEKLEYAFRAFLLDLALQIEIDQLSGLAHLSTPPAEEEYWECFRQSPLHLTFDTPIPTPAQQWMFDIRLTERREMKLPRQLGKGNSRAGMNCQIHFLPGLPHSQKEHQR